MAKHPVESRAHRLFPGPLHPFPRSHSLIPCPNGGPKVLPTEKIHLGLDLRGGMYLLLEVEVQKAVDSAMDKYASDIKDTLAKKDIPFIKVERAPDGKDLRHLAGQQGQRPFHPDSLGPIRKSEGGLLPGEGRQVPVSPGDEPEGSQVHRGFGRPPGTGDHPQPRRPVRGNRAADRPPGGKSDSGPASRNQRPPASDRIDRPYRSSGVQAGG